MGEGEFTKKPRNRKKLLFQTILKQMEFYFSDSNLSKDRFFSQLLDENSSIRLDVFLKCNKIKKLNCTTEDIQKAIAKSELIGLTEDNKSVFRKLPLVVKEDVDRCTIYVENIKADADHDTLSQIFSDFGNVSYVSIPKYKHNRANKGFAFIEYETEEEANKALTFFESIGCKLSSNKKPEELRSIMTFEGDIGDLEKDEEHDQQEGIKRKTRTVPNHVSKRVKFSETVETKSANNIKEQEDETNDTEQKQEGIDDVKKSQVENLNSKEQQEIETTKRNDETNEVKKHQDEIKDAKKQKKKQEKRKTFIKELGMQVLLKSEWKKLRNYYLNLQWRKMKEFKQHLYKQKCETEEDKELDDQPQEQIEGAGKIKFTPGVIVKLKLAEPCMDPKKLKNELKVTNPEMSYVDVPLPMASEQVYLRFTTKEAALEFCNTDFGEEKTVIEGDEEKVYWEKIENDRLVKFRKIAKKQRGRDKLLKKAERESQKHMRFEENE